MKRSILLLLLTAVVSVALCGAVPQSANNYVAKAREALARKDYDKVMEWANKYAQERNSYEPFKDIAEQMRQDAASIYPNDKKAFVRPLEYAASMGNAHALYSLGIQYAGGQYLPKDEAKGLALLKASEKLGYANAGPMYTKLKMAFDQNAAIDRALRERQQKYNAQIIGAVTAAAVVVAAAALIGHSFKNSGSTGRSSSGYYGYSSSSSSRTNDVKSSDKQITDKPAEVDVEKIEMPSYTWDSDWYKDKVLPFNSEVENKGGENQVRKIRFGGVGVGKIYHVVGNKGYWSSKARYYTIEDAIIAEYVYLKYNKVRQKGRMVGIFY